MTPTMASDARADDVILRASEIGEYVHCGRAWWLGHVQGVENRNYARMEAGTARHAEHVNKVRRAGMLQTLAQLCLAVAVIAGVVLALRLAGIF